MPPQLENAKGPIDNYLQYRGKARPADDATPRWHPVAYHGLDHAACVSAILDARPKTLARGASLLGLSRDEAKQLLVTLGALHDIGKFSDSFFGQAEALWPSVHGRYRQSPRRPHTVSAYVLWQRVLAHRIGPRLTTGAIADLDALVAATFGHHGSPLARGRDKDAHWHFRLAGTTEAAVAFADDVISLLCPSPVPVPADWEGVVERASWWVAGLISLADWMASDQTVFQYAAPTLDLAQYWSRVENWAAEVVVRSGLAAPEVATSRSFEAIAGKTFTPTPVQRWALDVELPAGPALFIIEDVTGAGKTEAAQVLIHRLMAAGRAGGAYWGMPTQATANAMFDRQRETIGALFESTEGRRPSLVIAHAQAKFHDGFQKLIFDGWTTADIAEDTDDPEGSESEVACAAFIADDRRKAFLADVGAGTVDQAILGVLPSKFNTIRLFGLSEKVLVLDEVHAYDAYVENEIATLLEFHAALGGSAILLSATLTLKQREKFVAVWRRACGATDQRERKGVRDLSDATSVPYPLATIVDGANHATPHNVQAAFWSCRTVEVVQLHDEAEVVQCIVAAYRSGQAVAWIRNTVDSVLDAAELLRAHGIEPMIFHSRFAQSDRQAREDEVKATFGKNSAGIARNRVLVATQVIEQSLDLDFDCLVSDLAPIDLLIQRAGRLWRHERKRPERSKKELLVLAPLFEDNPGSRWLDEVLPKTKYVYEDLGVLWRTQRQLARAGKIVTPGGVRELVETVYVDPFVPESLELASQKALGRSAAIGMMARHFSLDWTRGYAAGSSTGWYADVHVPTRLAEEKTVIRLARLAPDGRVSPWADELASEWKAWALSEVRVSERKVSGTARVASKHAAAIDAVRNSWPEYECEVLVVVLESEDGWSTGEYVGENDSPGRVLYSRADGLRL